MPTATDDPRFLEAIIAPTTIAYRRADIYESDGVTPYFLGSPVVSGSVTADNTRAERRMIDTMVFEVDGYPLMRQHPGGLWYDKIIKPFRGVITSQGTFESQLGEFMIDKITETRFPKQLSISGRDFTKKMLLSKFSQATNFTAGSSPEYLIKIIATNAGITKFNLPVTNSVLYSDQFFDRGTDRWTACTTIANAYNYDLYFDSLGYLTMSEFVDPTLSPTVFTFQTGVDSNIADYQESTDDAELYNHVCVTGEGAGQIPVIGESWNNEPSSPTRIDKIGDRLYEYVSSFIYTTDQAQAVADSFLKIHALEQFELDLTTLIVPWLDVNSVIKFNDPDPDPGDPDRFLLTQLSIPMELGTMSAVGKRITIVG